MKRFFKNKRILSSILAFTMLFGLITIPEQKVHAEKAEHVVISEVYGGGGNSGAKFKNDFIELYNPTDKDVDITDWKIQYASKSGTFGTSNSTLLSGIIKANGYLLIQQAKGNGGNDDLPTPDFEGNIAMAGSDCKVRLVKADDTEIDFVGIGAADKAEGEPIKGMNAIQSVQRKDNDGTSLGNTNGYDTNNNANDFYPKEPTPRNSSYRVGEVEEVELKSLA
ncbi:lamin tail domain-containing protein, partial [Clostridium sp.]|uniref:lamin tail domain-containing protein n=1 Tax=Clostridium sp. TaxID=1506 RepID=UPI00261C8A49